MSMYQVLETTLAAAQDAGIGLSAKVAAVLASLGGTAPTIRNEFAFGKWAVRNAMQQATAHSVVFRPVEGADQSKPPQAVQQRDAVQIIECAVECFGADLDEVQHTLTIAQIALLMMLDALPEYSRTHGGTIWQVMDPVESRYGEFAGSQSGTAGGFICRITINERSSQ